jgi:hypothetical protein
MILLIRLRKNSAQSRGHQDANGTMLQSLLSLAEQQIQRELTTKSDISTHFNPISVKMDSNHRMYKESLNEGFSTLTRDRDVKLDQAIRRVLDTYFLPRVEECFSKNSKLQNAALLQLTRKVSRQTRDQALSQTTTTTSIERGLSTGSDYTSKMGYASSPYHESESFVTRRDSSTAYLMSSSRIRKSWPCPTSNPLRSPIREAERLLGVETPRRPRPYPCKMRNDPLIGYQSPPLWHPVCNDEVRFGIPVGYDTDQVRPLNYPGTEQSYMS